MLEVHRPLEETPVQQWTGVYNNGGATKGSERQG